MVTVEEIRKSLRISHKNLDDEIERTKDACLLDMERVGICFQNKLTDSAVILYCKADFDFQGKGQQYMRNYEKLRDAMSLCETYREGTQEDVFGNEEYICAAVYLRYMYQDLPNGLYIVRISQETLEIVDFINPTIDERKL